ncbi:scarecrow-like protein 1 [Rutidosis leptorrhynchoides]|uniref:scarecrow-like protein 1 n=1 Tax=Rutidosis leptorrhynchoides TaxID=125765 RepID=UPI003A99C909
MSLVRPVEHSATSCRNPKSYSLKENNDSDSYSIDKYFTDSPSEELIHPPSISGASFDSLRYPSNFDSEGGGYDENEMRLKLQELERALLADNDVNFDQDYQSMDVDAEWSSPLNDDDESSLSLGSNLSTTKETSSKNPREMLMECASAVSEGNHEEALSILNEVRQIVSIQGDPQLRIAAYMTEGLAARMAASGKYIYKALKCKEPPSLDRLAAMQILFEVCPCFKFGFMAANGAIIEAFKGEKRVHIIDFDISQGSQYIQLIQTIATQPGNRPHLRLTGVDDPDSVQRPVGGLRLIGMRLEKLAEQLGVEFEFQAVPSKTSIVTPSMLDCRPGEALVVNFAFQLHHMPDESVSTVNERDQLLRLVKSLKPKLVTVVEQDVNTNTAPFFPRFIEAYNYYSTVFNSLDATLPRESQDRMNVEKQCLARDIVNIVACEGEERIERYEVAGKWRARMTMAGFTSQPWTKNVVDMIRDLITQYCDRYKLKQDLGALHFGWEDKSLIVASTWR